MCTKEQCTLTALYVHVCKRSLITIVHFVTIRATNVHTVSYLASRDILIMINGTASCEQFKITLAECVCSPYIFITLREEMVVPLSFPNVYNVLSWIQLFTEQSM